MALTYRCVPGAIARLLQCLVIVASLSCAGKKSGQAEGEFDALFSAHERFSGVALVADHGKVVYHKAFGFRNFETSQAMDTNAVFELASLSKQFTAMVIMILKDEGALNFDDPVETYLPELPYKGITIRHLLNHTSGLPDYQEVMDAHWDKTAVAGNEDNIRYLVQFHPAAHFAAGDRFEYSNTGYMLLATIAERASGQDFLELSREKIFSRLDLRSTGIRTRDETRTMPSMAWGHLYVEERKAYVSADSFPAFNYTIWLGNRKGPGRVSSTTTDLLKWDQALSSNQLVSASTMMEAFSPARLNNDSLSYYGFGWGIERNPELGKMVWHSGDNPGYRTHIVRYIDARKTIILLNNNEYSGFDSILAGLSQLAVRREPY